MPASDIVVILIVTLIIFFRHNLALSVLVIISAFVFAWNNANRIRLKNKMEQSIVKFLGFFFGWIQAFNEKFYIVDSEP